MAPCTCWAGLAGSREERKAATASTEQTSVTKALPTTAPKEEKKAAEDSDSDDAKVPDKNSPEGRILAAMDRVLDEWFVFGMQRAGAKKFIQVKIANSSDDSCKRLQRWLLLRMNGKVWEHGYPLMCRSAENVPDLRAHHIWPQEEFPWLSQVAARHKEILQELLAARSFGQASEKKLSGFQPYRDPVGDKDVTAKDGVGMEAVDRGAWNVLYLLLNHKKFDDNCLRFPSTMRVIQETFPRQYSHAFFSALAPGSHIIKHTGPSNRMLRAWLPLCGLEGFKLRVGTTIVEPKAGEPFVFDHSFEHEAWHEGTETRVVLIVDIWHPDLTQPEIKFLSTLQNCRLRAGRALAERYAQQQAGTAEPAQDTYFDIVEKARHLLTDDDWWVVNAERDPTTKPT